MKGINFVCNPSRHRRSVTGGEGGKEGVVDTSSRSQKSGFLRGISFKLEPVIHLNKSAGLVTISDHPPVKCAFYRPVCKLIIIVISENPKELSS